TANQLDERIQLRLQLVDQVCQRTQLLSVPIEAHAAQTGHAAQQAVASELFVHAQHALFESHGVHVGDDERHVGADRADVGDVVVDAFQLQTNCPQCARTR